MSNLLMHKGYAGRVEFDADEDVLFGRVLGLRDVITFQGKSIREVRRAFRESVDDYLAYCRDRGEAPEAPKSGRFNVRVDPTTHRSIELAAEQSGLSLNKWIERNLREHAERELSRGKGK